MSSSVQPPCSGCHANAALLTRSSSASSAPTSNGRIRTPSGTCGSGSGTSRPRRIFHSSRCAVSPERAARAAAAGSAPCAQTRGGRPVEQRAEQGRPDPPAPMVGVHDQLGDGIGRAVRGGRGGIELRVPDERAPTHVRGADAARRGSSVE